MKKIVILTLLLGGFIGDGFAATRPTGRNTRGTASTATATGTTPVTSARAARSARTAPVAATSTTQKTVTRGRAATTAATKQPVVSARAATVQKVVGTGTKVATAAKNIVVDEECQAKYEGCMDSFCMLDNETGGRCLCSDKNAEYDEILAEIEKLDQQSYQMATFGVEKIEMGADADAVIASANAAAQSVIKDDNKKSARQALDLSMWDMSVDFEATDDVFGAAAMSPLADKEGDALHRAAAQICLNQIPECGSDLAMLQMMYAQRIKSDCAAYENSLKQQKNASQQKLTAAERALREAALEQYRSANKYDLGQCTVEFKKCMQTTAGCGNDFSGCAVVMAIDNTAPGNKKSKSHKIKGTVTDITISASTYDTLVAKKPLCETVTKSCVNVANQVWDTFLKEVAPQIKSAELIAEDNARQSCIGNISDCFQKACKDNIDPNDPDGSYDMCLTRPGSMLNLCKIPLNACGIDASSEAKAQQSDIWDFVVARLASMRVDACTTEVKNCLQSDDRCGKDYSNCVGLDTDTIIRMCPYDKLVSCQKVYGQDRSQDIRGEAVYDELASMVQGIMLNIDNAFLTECQNAVNEAMITVCGDTEDCSNLTIDENIGARSLEYKICEYTSVENSLDIDYGKCRTDVSQIQDKELGRVENSTSVELGPITPFAGVLDGTIYWESVEINDDGRLSTVDEYLEKIDDTGMSQAQKERVKSELAVLQKNIDTAINTIESDPKVQFCKNGRDVQGMRKTDSESGQAGSTRFGDKQEARFPELTKQMRMIIANAALKAAKDNYYKKYDELNEKMLQDYATIGERMAEIQGKNALDARREIARIACVNFADASSLPKSPNPPKSGFGKMMAAVALTAAAVAIPLTGGLSTVVLASGATVTMGAGTTAAIAAGAAGVAGIGLAGNAGSGNANGADGGIADGALGDRQLIGSKQLNQWNYKETITSTFEWETLKCEKCVRAQRCSKTKNPLFGSKYCKSWAEATETCNTTQF